MRGTAVSKHPLLDGLNPEQAAAITADLGPTLVLAGPGSGKTNVLTRRIAWLIQEHNLPHHRIMAVTFTNKAAGEMRSRVEKLLGSKLRGLQIGTFHSTCARFLRRDAPILGYRDNWVIYDSDDSQRLIKAIVAELGYAPKENPARRINNRISAAKNEMILPANYQAMSRFDERVARIYAAYQQALQAANAMDFGDLLLNMALLLQRSEERRKDYQDRFLAVLVDEFQDTNTVQYQLVKLLSAPQQFVFVVGDEDQAIYRFRGADYRNLLRFRKDYPQSTVILLEQNYRSTQTILDVAGAIISNNRNRTAKNLHTSRGQGEPIAVHEAYDEQYEADFVLEQVRRLRDSASIAYSDIAVIYRTNAQSRAFEEAFIRARLPYTLLSGFGFYQRREIKDLLAYLRLIYNPDDRVSFERIINTPARAIGKKSLQEFADWITREDLALSDALNLLYYDDFNPLSRTVKRKFREFSQLLSAWRDMAQPGGLGDLFQHIVAQTRYDLHLEKTSQHEDEALDRAQNLSEFYGMLLNADEIGQSLHDFLDERSLYTTADSLEDDDDKVRLSTFHSIKGLEFPAVFITGLEQDNLPHRNAIAEGIEGIEEECRLFYVGITRAEDHLFLSYALQRRPFGGSSINGTSQFLSDLPAHLLDGSPLTLAYLRQARAATAPTQWEPRHPIFERKPKPIAPSANPTIRAQFAAFKAPQKPTLRVGGRATHKQFGDGLVIGIESTGDIASVLFDQSELKKVFAEDLTPLGE
ncbi:MAG: UvrD-helicase domain-containing protein [Chloroflexi bacterium]|nr:UvrD-helicase domain-containing protein [Chloroflexota bacterium]MCY3583112.1 UvrD-helicase domain-containing protein [Chloroflexota bacterium]MCY3715116.1 UvrD-helicase domain-containing protein [Chloroflexota bacterium]MDE2650327.1 UvrD-helicase domain-containing protein [Chloroflexota bacterium]MXX83984.1 AAA family ATPase [Chloroflexota bacterium]